MALTSSAFDEGGGAYEALRVLNGGGSDGGGASNGCSAGVRGDVLGGTEMQVGSAVQGASTKHPHRGLKALLAIAAILVIAALVALVMWVTPLAAPSGVGTEDAIPKAGAGSAVDHHVGNMQPEAAPIVRPGPHHPQ